MVQPLKLSPGKLPTKIAEEMGRCRGDRCGRGGLRGERRSAVPGGQRCAGPGRRARGGHGGEDLPGGEQWDAGMQKKFAMAPEVGNILIS